MSTFKTNYTTITKILPHPKPEVHSLQIAKCYDFDVIIRKDTLKEGDKVFYVQIDSILPNDLETMLFGKDSKMKLTKGRIKQTRVQGFPSAGLIITTDQVRTLLGNRGLKASLQFELEKDYSELLEIKKYEVLNDPSTKQNNQNKDKRKVSLNPLFHTYNGLENVKYYPVALEGYDVIIQEKIHGSLGRVAYLPTVTGEFSLDKKYLKDKIIHNVNVAKRKLMKLIGVLPAYSHSWGSNTVDRTFKRSGGYYKDDPWLTSIENSKLFDKIEKDSIMFGEVVFEGCQKNYHYGHKDPHFILYDIKRFNQDGSWYWEAPEKVEQFAKDNNIDFVPVLYKGKYNLQLAKELGSGKSIYYPNHVMEGVVIKAVDPTIDGLPSKKGMFKYINPEYLDKDQSDFR